MKKRLKVLIATDYSEASAKAEMYGLRLAEHSGFHVEFLHIFEPPLANPLAPFDAEKIEYNPFVYEENKLTKHVTGLLESQNSKLSANDVSTTIREGLTGPQIIAEAEESDIDLIMVGTHGVSGFKEFFIGSHAWDVIKNSHIPVLAIPPMCTFEGIHRVVFATDYREGEIPGIKFALKLSRFLKADFKAVHVNNPFIKTIDNEKLLSEFQDNLINQLGSLSFPISAIPSDDVSEALDQYCVAEKADWLSMSPEIPSLLEKIFVPNVSMTRKMSFLTNIPLLAIPDFYNTRQESFWDLISDDTVFE